MYEKLKAALRKPDVIDAEWLVLVIVLALAGIVGVIAWSLLLGGLLTLILPFRLFEAALLVMIATALIAQGIRSVAGQTETRPPAQILEAAAPPAPEIRPGAPSWEVWFRAELAEALHEALYAPEPALDVALGESLDTLAGIRLNRARSIRDAGWHDTAARLAEAITLGLRDHPPAGKRLKVSGAELRAYMLRHNLPMVDEELLAQVAAVVNRQLARPEVANMIYQYLWDKPTSVFG